MAPNPAPGDPIALARGLSTLERRRDHLRARLGDQARTGPVRAYDAAELAALEAACPALLRAYVEAATGFRAAELIAGLLESPTDADLRSRAARWIAMMGE